MPSRPFFYTEKIKIRLLFMNTFAKYNSSSGNKKLSICYSATQSINFCYTEKKAAVCWENNTLKNNY